MESVGMIIPFPINMEKHVPHHQPGWYNRHQPGWYLGSSPNIQINHQQILELAESPTAA